MKEILLALLTGALVGLLFGVLRLPIPAPPTWAGVAGIVGILVGFLVASAVFTSSRP